MATYKLEAIVLCVVVPYVDCVCLVTLADLAEIVAGMNCRSCGTMCWDLPVRIGTAEVGIGLGDPRALCVEGALVGQIKMKWVQAGGCVPWLFVLRIPWGDS